MGKKKYNKGAQQQQQAQGSSQQQQGTSQQPPQSTSAGDGQDSSQKVVKKPQAEQKLSALSLEDTTSSSGAGDYHRKPQKTGKAAHSQDPHQSFTQKSEVPQRQQSERRETQPQSQVRPPVQQPAQQPFSAEIRPGQIRGQPPSSGAFSQQPPPRHPPPQQQFQQIGGQASSRHPPPQQQFQQIGGQAPFRHPSPQHQFQQIGGQAPFRHPPQQQFQQIGGQAPPRHPPPQQQFQQIGGQAPSRHPPPQQQFQQIGGQAPSRHPPPQQQFQQGGGQAPSRHPPPQQQLQQVGGQAPSRHPPPQQQFQQVGGQPPSSSAWSQQSRASPQEELSPPGSTHSGTSTELELQKMEKAKTQKKGSKKTPSVSSEAQKPSSNKQEVSSGQKSQPQSAKKKEVGKKDDEGSPTDLIVPLRKQLQSGGTKGRKIIIETNHLPLILKNLKPATHYDVAIDPDKPKKCLRLVMEQFRRNNYPDRYPAFDGMKNLYSSSPLPFGREIDGEVTIVVDEQEKKYKVKVKYAAEINLQCLADYFGSNARANRHMVTPQEAIQALDIVLRNAPALRCIPVGRSFFTRPNPQYMVDLGEGMEMYSGIYQSAILGWKPFLNVDVSHKAFPKSMHLLDLVHELCDRYQISQPLIQYNYETVDRFVRTLKVIYQIPNQPNSRRIMRVNQLDRPAKDARFTNEQNREMTVADYFSHVKQVPLKYPHLPCLWVGSRNREPRILLPMEFCTVLDGQVTNRTMTGQQTTNMIRSAATSTQVRKRKIMDSVRQANYNRDPCIREFSLTVNEEFTKVQARVLDPPRLVYQRGPVHVQRGVWKPDLFLKPSDLQKWSIVCLHERTRPEELETFGAMMVQQGRTQLGMNISRPEIVSVPRLQRNREKEAIENIFAKLKGHQLILVVIPDIKEFYHYVKQTAEIRVGVVTQCVKSKNLFRPKPSTVGNILLKVNAKLNGLNHKLHQTPVCLQVPCMIMGADVTHPSPESRGSVPSVAAVTASHDPCAFKYNITCRLQQSTQEIITDLANIVYEHLTYFEKVNRRRPERIIFFRDGVSEGQFEIVVRSEVQAVFKGCAKLDPSGSYKPKLTFLVVQKRHHTRFFPTNPKDSEDKNCNVPAGTVVDTEITHPTALDFYLVSHASIQGVARPTKYRKLWDDDDMQEDELEELTYHLCHLFARCTRSVSYPAPTYYAHLAAARAKVYCENQRIDMNNLERSQSLLAIKNEVVKGSPMYFV